MSATRQPMLHCDARGCHGVIWTLTAWLIPDLRRHASGHGWAHHDRKDWCPVHARMLGITKAADDA